MKIPFPSLFIICAGLLALSPAAPAAVRLPAVIASHMVLQRDIAVPIWGTADPGEKVTVKFRGQEKTTAADAQGKWMVKLDPLKVGEASTLTVSGANILTLTDVLVGEVWVGSGQSNLDTPVSMYLAQDPALKEAADIDQAQVRLFHPVQSGTWMEASPANLNPFSAQLFYFGLLLHKQLNIPIGLMQGAQGGTPSMYFIPQQGFNGDPAIQTNLAKWDMEHPLAGEQKKYEDALEKWKQDVAAARAAASASPANQTNGVPSLSSTASFEKMIRSKYPEPAVPIRAMDIRTGAVFERAIRPMIPFAIRGVLWDQGESGTGIPAIDQPMLMSALIRSWRKDWGQGDFPWIYVQKPSGGGCAFNPADPVTRGAIAFAPLPANPPVGINYGRSDSYNIMKITNTFLTITSDLATGIHPINKSGYATRDSQVALAAVYGGSGEYYGPIFQSFKVDGNKIDISYTHVGKGLAVPPGQKLQGFAIAGEDEKWHWADARIEGQTVALSSPDVPTPAAARYWPFAWANLFNADGLPASGFRTDSWKR